MTAVLGADAGPAGTPDTDRAIQLARRIEAGATFVNSHNLSSLSFDMPFGGVKRSGLGRERTALGCRSTWRNTRSAWSSDRRIAPEGAK
jgi:acyl-CoA reductase-like NAD-dependent aldehyde dehydrogenase